MCVRLTPNKKMGVDSGTIQKHFQDASSLGLCVCNFPVKPVHCLSFKTQHLFLPWSQRFSCLSLLSERFKGVNHHYLVPHIIFYRPIYLIFCVLCGLCMCSTCVPSAGRSQKTALDPLKPEIQWL